MPVPPTDRSINTLLLAHLPNVESAGKMDECRIHCRHLATVNNFLPGVLGALYVELNLSNQYVNNCLSTQESTFRQARIG